MVSTKKLCDDANIRPAGRIAFSVLCGISTIMHTIVHHLEQHGFAYDPDAPITVILDTPYGFAMQTLAALPATAHRRIVVTWNPCAEYRADLGEMHPDVLLTDPSLNGDLTAAIRRVARGECCEETLRVPTSLTPTERQMLRLLAHGYATQQIAEQLCVQGQTVRNTLTTIYQKLGLTSRNEAMLYYWGTWHAFTEAPLAVLEQRG